MKNQCLELKNKFLTIFRYFADTLAHNENGLPTTRNETTIHQQVPPTRLLSPNNNSVPNPGNTSVPPANTYKDSQGYVHT